MTNLCPTCAGTRTVRLEPAGPDEWWWGPCRDCVFRAVAESDSILAATEKGQAAFEAGRVLHFASGFAALRDIDREWAFALWCLFNSIEEWQKRASECTD